MQFKKIGIVLTAGTAFFICGLLEPLFAQCARWQKIDVGVGGAQINGVAISPDGNQIVLSNVNLHSSDGGVAWELIGSVPEIPIFGDNTHLFGVGSSQDYSDPRGFAGMFWSTDYGKIWTGSAVRTPMCFREVFFLDSLFGWAVGYGKDSIVVTQNGGKNLTTKSYGIANYIANGVSFLDTLRGWVAGSGVLSTTDGGNTWSQLSGVGAWAIDFVDTLHGWLLRSDGSKQHVYVSSDGGYTWIEHSSPIHQEIRQIRALDSLRCWAIGVAPFPYDQRIWKTIDGGQSWITEYSGPGGSLTDIDMADNTHGVTVGNSGTVLIYGPAVTLGDLNGDAQITITDVVLELNKVFRGEPFSCPNGAADVNCDGFYSPSDVVLLLNQVYLHVPFPCNL